MTGRFESRRAVCNDIARSTSPRFDAITRSGTPTCNRVTGFSDRPSSQPPRLPASRTARGTTFDAPPPRTIAAIVPTCDRYRLGTACTSRGCRFSVARESAAPEHLAVEIETVLARHGDRGRNNSDTSSDRWLWRASQVTAPLRSHRISHRTCRYRVGLGGMNRRQNGREAPDFRN
jgi:hypothetical protein